ncbi:MAG: hypothetical protein GY774_00420 [Planctomycetes bacterium]|nr:hypothetical protein [Planctomycetota bacterium]
MGSINLSNDINFGQTLLTMSNAIGAGFDGATGEDSALFLFLLAAVGQDFQLDQVEMKEMTDTSAGPISVILEDGTAHEYAAEVPLVTENGVASVGAITNKCVSPRDLTNAVWMPPGTTNIHILSSIPAPDGSLTTYKITDNGAFNFSYQSAIMSDEDIKGIWARTVSGTGTAHILRNNTLAGSLVNLTETWQWFESVTNTADLGDANFYLVDFRGSGTLDEVVLWWPMGTVQPYYPLFVDGTSADRGGTASLPFYKTGATQSNLMDHYDGKADGVDLFQPFTNIGIGWTKINDRIYSCDGTQTATTLLSVGGVLTVGGRSEVVFVISGQTAGLIRPYFGGSEPGGSINTDGTYTQRGVCVGNDFIYFSADANFVGTVEVISWETISPAFGKQTGEFTVNVAAADTPNNSLLSILSVNGAKVGLLYLYRDTIGGVFFRTNDGIGPTSIDFSWLANTTYEYKLLWGWHTASAAWKMQLHVRAKGTTTWTSSTITDFAGRYPITGDYPDQKLTFGYGADAIMIESDNHKIKSINTEAGWATEAP